MTERESQFYICTVDMKDGKPTDYRVDLIRDLVKQANQKNTRQVYVKLQGRGHRQGVRRYNQSLPLRFATHADVYVYNRYQSYSLGDGTNMEEMANGEPRSS